MALTKQGNFSQQPSELPDVPSPSMTPDQIRAKWQTPLDELKTTINNAFDKLNSTTKGSSGADNLGAPDWDGVTASTVGALLSWLKANKTDLTGDHKGTWQGFTPSKADPGISLVVEQHTAQLADIAINVKSFGAKGDGITDDITALENAVASLKDNQTLIAQGTFYISREWQLNKDNVNYDFTKATFIGPTAGTLEGCLVCVVNRNDSAHTVANIEVLGGTYIPKNANDNGLGVAINAKGIRILNPTTDLTTGQRGVVVQNSVAGQLIEDVIIYNVRATGGVNAVDVETTADQTIKNIVINTVIADGTDAVIRTSAGNTSNRIKGVSISNVIGINNRMIFDLNHTEVTFNNIQGLETTYRPFSFNYCDKAKGDLKVSTSVVTESGGGGLMISNESNNVDIEVNINGDFDYGIYSSCKSSKIKGIVKGTFKNNLLYTIGGFIGNHYDLITDTTSPLCNSYRDGDYYNLYQYSASGIQEFRPKQGGTILYGTAPPTAGTYNKPAMMWNTNPVASGYAGWVLISSGTPGTWKGFGTIQA